MTAALVKPVSRWALRQTKRLVLADRWGVSPTRASHKVTSGDAVAENNALIAHPEIDGAAILASNMAAYEMRQFLEVRTCPSKMRARLDVLLANEHRREAEQNAALQSRKDVVASCLSHIATLLEIVVLWSLLGLEDA